MDRLTYERTSNSRQRNMSSTNTTVHNEPSPGEQIFQISMGFIPAICLNVVARLSVADHLAQGPRNVGELARATNSNEDALYRVMRAVSNFGIFKSISFEANSKNP